MSFFKYLFILILFFLSQFSHSAYTCGRGAKVTLTTNLEDWPAFICADVGGNNCLVFEDYSEKNSTGWTIYATSTGETCSAQTNLNSPKPNVPDDNCTRLPDGSITCPEEPEKPDDTILVCTASSCPNPDNKRCPTGYVKGSFNGQNLCVKSSKPTDPNPDPDEGDGESTKEIINAIDKASSDISGSLSGVGNSLKDMFGELTGKLGEISQKLSNISNGNGDNNNNSNVDTSGLHANLPMQQVQKHNLDQNLFNSNAQCPADNSLSMTLNGRTFTHNFSYVEICNALNMLSFLLMCGAYLFAVHILVAKT